MNVSYILSFRHLGLAQAFGADDSQRAGTIGPSSSLNDDGKPYQEISESLHAGQRLYFVVRSSDFNPRLQLLAPDGAVLDENDDYGQGTDARIDYTVRSAGQYRLRIIANAEDSQTAQGNWSLQAWEIK